MVFGERIPIKTRNEIQMMRMATRHVGEVLLELRERVADGVTTAELDQYASKAINERGVESGQESVERITGVIGLERVDHRKVGGSCFTAEIEVVEPVFGDKADRIGA